MKTLAVNPYLPSWEFVPDGEPHVFEGRLYVYGSHDRAHGVTYCEEDYVGWSAPLDDPGDFRYEGVIYRKDQDEGNPDGKKLMFAPDVARGPDGRYYLYYGLSDVSYIGVAVSDSPAGPFTYYGRVTYPDGTYPAGLAFDPGVLVEEDRIYLYYGFACRIEDAENEKYRALMGEPMPGAYMVRLDADMKTVISKPVLVAHGALSAAGTGYEEHPFFEASSIRRIRDRYYFIYSSVQGHELCYATADTPEGPFAFGGVIISNGDVGMPGGQTAYDANNHGSIVELNGQHYIFYHRHTHGTHFSRQGCAEKITVQEDGSIAQVEITSCGLCDGPLPADRTYPAAIICNLHGPEPACHIPSKPPYDPDVPYLWEALEEEYGKKEMYLRNMRKGACCGVKYLEFTGQKEVRVCVKGSSGLIRLCLDSESLEPAARIMVESAPAWHTVSARLGAEGIWGTHAVYFCFEPDEGSMDMHSFSFA